MQYSPLTIKALQQDYLIYIRDFLGYVHVETIEAYAKADTEMKRKTIEQAQIQITSFGGRQRFNVHACKFI